MIMNEPNDPFRMTRLRVFLWGSGVTLVLAGLIFYAVPPAPKAVISSAPLQGPGSVQSTLEEPLISQPAIDTSNPKALFMRFCGSCHGDTGNGKSQMARMSPVPVPNLISGPFKFERTPEAVRNLILKGSPSGAMPGFERELGEQGATVLAQYALELAKEKP